LPAGLTEQENLKDRERTGLRELADAYLSERRENQRKEVNFAKSVFGSQGITLMIAGYDV
jgi:hypothetical protein